MFCSQYSHYCWSGIVVTHCVTAFSSNMEGLVSIIVNVMDVHLLYQVLTVSISCRFVMFSLHLDFLSVLQLSQKALEKLYFDVNNSFIIYFCRSLSPAFTKPLFILANFRENCISSILSPMMCLTLFFPLHLFDYMALLNYNLCVV